MGRRLILWCGLCVCLLGGCRASQPTALPVTCGFTCNTAIQYKEMAITGALSRSSAGSLELALSSPPSLEGMVLSWNGEGVSASLYGMTVDVDPSTLPMDGLGSVLTRTLDSVGRTPEEGKLTDKGWEWQGRVDGQSVTLISDPSDGTPRSLELPQIPLKVTFSNFKQM